METTQPEAGAVAPANSSASADAAALADALALVAALDNGLPGGRLVVDPDVLAALSHDHAEWAPVGRAVAAVRARTEGEVQHVVRTRAQFGAPVVPRGAGTGLSGGANATDGAVVLDLSRMDRVLEIDAENRSRPRRCSTPGGSPTRRSNGSGRCSPRTCASPARPCRRC